MATYIYLHNCQTSRRPDIAKYARIKLRSQQRPLHPHSPRPNLRRPRQLTTQAKQKVCANSPPGPIMRHAACTISVLSFPQSMHAMPPQLTTGSRSTVDRSPRSTTYTRQTPSSWTREDCRQLKSPLRLSYLHENRGAKRRLWSMINHARGVVSPIPQCCSSGTMARQWISTVRERDVSPVQPARIPELHPSNMGRPVPWPEPSKIYTSPIASPNPSLPSPL